MSKIFNFTSISKFEKISLQYIDFFEFNIFEKGKINCNNIQNSENIFLRSSYIDNDIVISKVLTNEGKFKNKTGSIVDINTTSNFDKENFMILIDELHNKNIAEFKKVIPNDIIQELGL